MTHTQKWNLHSANWNLLSAAPENLLRISNPLPDMEAYALRRRPFLLFDRANWKIDPEYVCPGISVWGKRHDFYAKPGKPPKCLRDSRSATSKLVGNDVAMDLFKQLGIIFGPQGTALCGMMDSVGDWEHFRALAFMPPHLIDSAVRKKLRKSDFHTAVQIANEVALKHWGSLDRKYPTVDYEPSK